MNAPANLEAHPLAEIFPLLDGEELQRLAVDIRRRGLENPIVLYEGKILDGRNRYAACKITGTEVRSTEYQGDDALAFVLSQNLHRRHLKESQRALIAASLVNWPRGVNQATARPANLPVWKAASLLNISPRSVKNAQSLLEKAVPETVAAVRSGAITLHAATRTARKPVPADSPFSAVVSVSRERLGDVLWADLRTLAAECRREARLLEAIADHVANPPGGAIVREVVAADVLTAIIRGVTRDG